MTWSSNSRCSLLSGASALLLESHSGPRLQMITLFGNNDPPPSLLDRFKQSVGKTRSEIAARVEGMFAGDRRLDPEELRRLENALLAAALRLRPTKQKLEAVRQSADREPIQDA